MASQRIGRKLIEGMESGAEDVAGDNVGIQQGGEQFGVLDVLLCQLLDGLEQSSVPLLHVVEFLTQDGLRVGEFGGFVGDFLHLLVLLLQRGHHEYVNVAFDSAEHSLGVEIVVFVFESFQVFRVAFDVLADAFEFSLLLGEEFLDVLETLHDFGLVVLGAAHGVLELVGGFGLLHLHGLLLDRRHVLEFDLFLLVDGAFSLRDDLGLLLDETGVAQFHAVEFLLEFFDFGLTDVGVECFLHFLFQLVLAFPEEDLAFALHDFVHEFCLFLADEVDVVLQLGGFVLHFLEFFDELALEVDVLVLQLLLLVAVERDGVVEFVHFLLQPLQVDLDLVDFPLEVLVVVIEAALLLLHDGLLVLQVGHALPYLLELVVLVDEDGLLLDPLAVEFGALLLEFLALPEEIDEFVLIWILALVVSFAHEFVVEFVESAYFVLLLLVDVVALLDLYLIGNDQILLLILLRQRLLLLLLEQFDLGLGVELVDLNACDFVEDVLQLDLFLLDVLPDLLRLLQQVVRRLLDRRVLALLVDQRLVQLLRLRVQLHYAALHLVHRLLHRLLLHRRHLYVLLSVPQRLLQTHQLRRHLLLLRTQLPEYYVQRTLHLTDESRLRPQLLRQLLLLADFVLDAGQFVQQQRVGLPLAEEAFAGSLDGGVSLLHHHDGLLPAVEQSLGTGDHLLHLHLCLVENLLSVLRLLTLRDDLCSEDVLLLLETLALLIHGVDKEILFLLDLFEVGHVVLGSEGLLLGDGDVRLQLHVVRFDFVVVPHQVLQFLLRLRHLVPQHVRLLLLRDVEFVHLRQFLFGLDAQSLCDVVVVVGAFVVHLVGGELLLRGVETHSYLFLLLLHQVALGLRLLVLQFQLLLPLQVLLLEFLLQVRVQRVVRSQEFEVLLLAAF